MSWGTELWDQYENLSFHTQKGIDFLDRYANFIKDRCAIETEYASKLRRLVKNYQPKKKDEEEYYQFTACKAFKKVMSEVTDLAGQHEIIVENLQSDIIKEIIFLIKDFKEGRKKCLQDGARCMALLSSQISSLERAKKNYEKAFKEAERALEGFQRADADFNLSRAEVEKQRTNMAIKSQHCDESKTEYANQLQKTNDLQRQHFYVLMPEIFSQLQELDEKRIKSMKSFMANSAEVERKVFPIINQCLNGIVNAANEINEKEDSLLVIEKYKSGFKPPEDFPFEDLSSRESEVPTLKNVTINSFSNYSSSLRPDRTVKGTLSIKNKKRSLIPWILGSNKNNIPSFCCDKKDDFIDLPPNQRKKKIQQKMEEIQIKIQQETAARDGLMKMKGVYEENPALGDPMSIEGQLNESNSRLEKFKTEILKFQALLDNVGQSSPTDVKKNSCSHSSTNGVQHIGSDNSRVSDSRRNSFIQNEGSLSRSASESSVTKQPQEKSLNDCPEISPTFCLLPNTSEKRYGCADSPESSIGMPHTQLPDDDFSEFNEPPPLGTCRAVYPFEATSEGSIPMYEGEELLIIELDQGDGWTRVRRENDTEEGFVPTSYIECHVYDT